MPQLTWTINADDSHILQSLTGIAAAADRAAAAVKQVGQGGSAGGAGSGAAQTQLALINLGRQADTLQRQLRALGLTQPQVKVTADFTAVQTDLRRVQAAITQLSQQAPTAQVRIEATDARITLAQIQRDFAALRGGQVAPVRIDPAPALAALAQLGTRTDDLIRKLQLIGQAHPQIAAQSNFQQTLAQLSALQTRLNELAAKPVTAQTQIDTRQARADLAVLVRELAAIKATVPVVRPVFDPTPIQSGLLTAQGAVTAFERRLESLAGQRPAVRIETNFQQLQTEATALQTRLRELAAQPITPQTRVDLAQARTALATLQRDLLVFRNQLPPITPQLNTAPIQTALVRTGTQIDALQRNLQRLGQQHPTIQAQANFQALTADLTALQTRLHTLGSQPITVATRGDLATLRTQLAGAQRDFGALRGSIPPATQAVESFGAAHEKAARQTATLLSRIQGIATGLIIYRAFAAGEAAITHTIAASLQLAAGLEQARQGFVAFDGSVQAANHALAALQRFSIATPLFDTQNTRQFALQLQGVGESAQRVIPDLRDLGAVVIGGGGGATQIQEAVLAYQQVIALGKLQGQEARQFANALVPVWNIVSEGLNVSIAQARQLSEQGQITANVFQQAFSLYAARHFADTLAQAGQTFNGLASQARESWQAALTEFGTGLAQGILPTLRDVATTLQDPRTLAAIRQWGVDAGQFVGQLWQGARIVAQWAGLALPEFPRAPDYSGTVTDTDALARNLAGIAAQAQTLATLQESYTADIRGAQAQIEQMQAAQVAADRQASDAIAAQRDAQTAKDRTYDAEIGRLRTIGTQLERNHEIARQEREEANLVGDIGRDELRAVDVYSSAGQAAAKRLKDERERLANLRADQQYNTARTTNQDAIANQEALRKGYDQQQQDAITTAERLREAQSRQSADAIKNLQGQIDTWKQVLEAIKAPIPVVDEFGNALDATFDQIQITAGQTTTAAISAATTEYRQFYEHTLPDLATQGRPLILTALFGTGQEQQDAGRQLAENFITGLGNALQNNSNDTLKWFGDLLRGDWAAAAQDYPLIKTIGDTGKNIGNAVDTANQQKAATPGGPPHMADPNRPGWVDVGPTPGTWRYDPAEWERLTGQRMPTVNSAPGGSGADFGPGVYGPGYNGPYSGGRAGGGPVWPGGVYTVGEAGPETLVMGARGGVVVPTYAQAAPGGGNTQLTITVRTERGEVLGIVETAIAQQVTGKFMATRMGAYASR